MRRRFAPMSVVAPILITLIVFSSLIVAFASPSHAVSHKSTASTIQAQDNLPYPKWWNGTPCDTKIVSNSAPLGTYYRGMPACGPIGLPADPSHKVIFPGGFGEYEWQCVELSMRFMYLAYGINAYYSNGNDVVDNYTNRKYNPGNYNNPILVPVANDGKSKTLPKPGDILSYTSASSFGHTSVVTGTIVDSTGQVSITTIEQNSSPTGTARLKVKNGIIGSGVKNWLHHTLDVAPQSGFRDTSVQFSGTGFIANEPITITFYSNGSTAVVGRTTANKSGAFSTTFSVPSTAQPGRYTIQATGSKSKFSPRTVFYVHSRGGWPMFGYNPQHTHYNPTETAINPMNVSNLTLDWSYNTGFNTLNSSAAVVNGIVYINTISEVDAIDLTTHSLLWSITPSLSSNIDTYSSPAVINGVVYVGSTDGNLYALDALTGNLKWAFPARNAIETSPAVSNGIVYFGSVDGSLYAVDATTGTLKWEFSTGSYIYTSPAVANGMVYFGSDAGTFYALDASTSTVKWTYVSGPPVSISPTINNGVVYLNADNGLHAFNATTGASLWLFPLPTTFASAPAVANGVVYVGSNAGAVLGGGTVYAVNATTGGLIWSYPLDPNAAGYPPATGTPVVANGVVFVATDNYNNTDINGTLYALDATTGSQLWSYTTGGSILYSSPVVEDGVVCIGAAGTLYAFHLPGSTP